MCFSSFFLSGRLFAPLRSAKTGLSRVPYALRAISIPPPHFVLLRNRSASLPIPAARQGRAQERTSKKKSLRTANFKTCRKACKSTTAFLKHIFFRKRNFPRNPVSASQESKDWIFRRFCAIFYLCLCRKFLKSAVTSFSFFQMKEIRWSPAHIHVRKNGSLSKFWIKESAELADNIGFSSSELKDIQQILNERKQLVKEAWNEFFKGKR